jgi:hypothetical protein
MAVFPIGALASAFPRHFPYFTGRDTPTFAGS